MNEPTESFQVSRECERRGASCPGACDKSVAMIRPASTAGKKSNAPAVVPPNRRHTRAYSEALFRRPRRAALGGRARRGVGRGALVRREEDPRKDSIPRGGP